MKFNTQKKTYFKHQTLIQSRFLLFFVNILTLYLHLTTTKNVKDISGIRELKTKSRVKLQLEKVRPTRIYHLCITLKYIHI